LATLGEDVRKLLRLNRWIHVESSLICLVATPWSPVNIVHELLLGVSLGGAGSSSLGGSRDEKNRNASNSVSYSRVKLLLLDLQEETQQFRLASSRHQFIVLWGKQGLSVPFEANKCICVIGYSSKQSTSLI